MKLRITKRSVLKDLLLSFLVVIIGLSHIPIASALSSENGSDPTGKSQRFIIENTPWYDPTACPGGSGNSGTNNYFNPQTATAAGKTYILSDSIGVGLKNAGLEQKLSQKNYPTNINANNGRSISTPGFQNGGGSYQNGFDAITSDTAYIKDSKNIVIALGTYQGGNFAEDQKKLIDQIKSINPNANISWVDVFSIGANQQYRDNAAKTNTAIVDNQTSLGYKLIDAYKLVWGEGSNPKDINKQATNPGTFLSSDNIVPTQDGYNKYMDYLVQTIAAQNPNQGQIANPACKCPSAGGVSSAGLTELEGKKLPAYKGGTKTEASIDANGKFIGENEKVRFSGFAKLGQEYRDYYITMRWNYAAWPWDPTYEKITAGPESAAWYGAAPRKVLVTNPKSGKSIIAPILEAGPAPWTGTPGGRDDAQQRNLWRSGPGGKNRVGTPDGYLGRVSGFPPPAIAALGLAPQDEWMHGKGVELLYSWAPDQNAKPGPVVVEGTNPVTQISPTSGSIVCNENLDSQAVGGNYVFYSQHDPKWANSSFGGGTISKSGCGPTSTAMAITNLTGRTVLPPEIATKYGYMRVGGGASWELFRVAPQAYGLKSQDIGTSYDKAREALKAGAVIIVSGRGVSPFTPGGHILTLRGLDAQGNFFLGDPNVPGDKPAGSNIKNTKAFSQNELAAAGLRNMWAISK